MESKDKEDLLLERIAQALQIAKLAVESDIKGDYAPAAASYKECLEILETDVLSAPEDNQRKMFELVNTLNFPIYLGRLTNIEIVYKY